MEGDALVVNCTVEADQHRAVEITWTRDGELIDVFDEKSS